MRPKTIARRDDGLNLEPWRGVAVALVFAAALLLTSCGAQGEQQGGDDGDAQGEANAGEETGRTRPVERVTVEELTANPGEFYGTTVTVSGEVVEAVEPGAVRIERDGKQLLVMGVEQIPQIVTGDTKAVTEGDRIRATGEVRQFDKEEIQQSVDYGMDDEYFSDYEGDPAVMAYSVEVIS